jgi:hypothetical protein
VEEKREEEVATEESQAFSRYEGAPRHALSPAGGHARAISSYDGGGDGFKVPLYLPALILLAAIGGASVRGGPGARRRVRPAPVTPSSSFFPHTGKKDELTTEDRTRRSL